MIVHQNRRAILGGAGVLEIANHLAFVAVGADDGQTASLEAALEAGIAGDLLAADLHREIDPIKQASDGVAETGISICCRTWAPAADFARAIHCYVLSS